MKKFLLILLSFALFFPGFNTYAQEPEEVPIIINVPPGNHPHSPQLSPISCYLLPSTASLLFSSTTISGYSLILVENLTTGAYSMEEVYISSIPATIPLLGSGNYCITITLSNGPTYQGSFSYNNS